ncbi:TPA: hypothetical protein P8677_004918 [Klebsiella pneumoniae]|nr:hypothetical protein [Klebsiella pneumoniae]
MYLMALSHRRALRYPPCPVAFSPRGLTVACPEQTTVLTFARVPAPAQTLDACSRMAPLPDGDIVLSYFDHTPLFALLLWDIAHRMAVGRRLYLQHSDNVAALLTRSWYRPAFRATRCATDDLLCFTKVAPLPTEAERGLDAWSFGIPTGGADATALNHCVARILELGVPQTDILLCGRPPDGFRYGDRVRVVGDDIPDTPLHITRKKNTLARAARFPNLCLLHDRVLLPRQFYAAVQQFGDDFPLTGFQSFWFSGRGQTLPQRYSDFGTTADAFPPGWPAGRLSREAAAGLAFQPLYIQHPARSAFGQDYLTGSLCLCKRAVWTHVPQNEALYWQEHEDMEQAFCAAAAGIPVRINPYGLTQTLSCRSIILGHRSGLTRGGRVRADRPAGRGLLPRRPHLGLTETDGLWRLRQFAVRYAAGSDMVDLMPRRLSGVGRYRLIVRLLWAARGEAQPLLRDWYRFVLCEAPVPAEAAALEACLTGRDTPARKKVALLRHPGLLRQVRHNPFSSPFLPDEPVPPSRVARLAGSLLSALWLRYGSRHAQLRLSLPALWRELARALPAETEVPHDAR